MRRRLGPPTAVAAESTPVCTPLGLSRPSSSCLACDRTVGLGPKVYAASVPNHEKFYLHYLTRDCARIQNLTDGKCTSIDETALPRGAKFASVVRDYLAPGTKRGPDPTKLLKPRIIKLQQP